MRYHVSRFMHRVGTGRKEACVYVHGFNNQFTKAAKKMALCGYKMQADVPLFMFSWPSYQVWPDVFLPVSSCSVQGLSACSLVDCRYQASRILLRLRLRTPL